MANIKNLKVNGTTYGINAHSADSATKLATARTISLSGDVSGSASFDGSQNTTITATVADDSHNHIIGNVDGLQTALDGKVLKRTSDGSSYTGLGNYYASGSTAKYVKISFPSVPKWTMVTMELTIRENYNSRYSGKLIIYANQSSNADWTISAIAYGTLTTAIKVYGSDKQHIYIGGISSWGGLSLDRMLIGDAAMSSDLTAMTLTGVDSLPTTYQTATMYYGVHSGNIGSQSVNYATSAGSATKASKIVDSANTSQSITASYASSQIAYDDITHLTCWNGYSLRAINKSEFAKANHTHSQYLTAHQDISGKANLSGATFTGAVTITSGVNLKFNKIQVPVSSGNSTYSNGNKGQVLKSNGTTVYWADDNNTDADSKTSSSNTTSKIYLVGATSQSSAGQTTYSNSSCYASGGYLYSNGKKVDMDNISGGVEWSTF